MGEGGWGQSVVDDRVEHRGASLCFGALDPRRSFARTLQASRLRRSNCNSLGFLLFSAVELSRWAKG